MPYNMKKIEEVKKKHPKVKSPFISSKQFLRVIDAAKKANFINFKTNTLRTEAIQEEHIKRNRIDRPKSNSKEKRSIQNFMKRLEQDIERRK